MDEAKLAEILGRVLDERRVIDAETHASDHAFVQMLKERERRRIERVERVRQHVIGWGVISAIGTAGFALWQWFLATVKHHQ